MPVVPARARVHRRHNQRTRGKPSPSAGARDANAAVLERLTEGLQHRARKLRELIQEEHPVVGQADLTRARDVTTAY
jgi:hypothetical protein